MTEKIHFPKITIITPSFNQGRYLEETIRSVLDQNYPNLEYIIIDGGSTDKSVEIIKKYEKRLAYCISEKDSGQSEAINKGLARATGEIVTWLNSDDYYEPGTFKLIAETFRNNENVSIVHGKTFLFGESIAKKTVGLNKDIEAWEYLPSMKIPQPSSFLSKKVFDAVGPLNEKLHYAMDFELIVKAILSGFTIKRLDATLSNYRLHKDSKSMDELKFLPDWSQVVYNLFSSVSGGGFFATQLEKLALVHLHTGTIYPATKTFTSEELEQVFLRHLILYYHYNYRFFNATNCKKISTYLFEHHKGFHKQQQLNKYNLRLKILPKFIFAFIRRYRH